MHPIDSLIDALVEYLVSGTNEKDLQTLFHSNFSVSLGAHPGGFEVLSKWRNEVGELFLTHRLRNERVAALELEVEKNADAIPLAALVDFQDGKISSLRFSGSTVNDSARIVPVSIEVQSYVEALSLGQPDALMDLFDSHAYIRDARGRRYGKRFPNALVDYFWELFKRGRPHRRYREFLKQESFCAAEFLGPRGVAFEFWDLAPSGRFEALRVYE